MVSFSAAHRPTFEDVTVAPAHYNPGNASLLRIGYILTHDALVTAEVMRGNSTVKKLLNAQRVNPGKNILEWNGKDGKGSVVGDGTYYIRLLAVSPAIPEFQSVYRTAIAVEKGNPGIAQLTVSPSPFKLTSVKQVSIRYSLNENARVSIGVYQGEMLVKSLISEELRRAGRGAVSWDGKDTQGRVVQRGVYTVRVEAVDAFGKTGGASTGVEFIPEFSVYTTEPDDRATDVAIDSKIQVTFTEPLNKDVDFRHIVVQVQGRNILYRGAVSGSTITLTPSDKLAYGTTYNVNISSGAVEDRTGRQLHESYVFSFTTEGVPRPDSDIVNLAGVITSSVTKTGNQINTSVIIDEEKALTDIGEGKKVQTALIPVTVDTDVVKATLTARLIEELAAKKALIQLRSPKASLVIPASVFKLDEIAEKLGAQTSDLCINIVLTMHEPAQTANFQNWIQKQKLTAISGPVQFRIEATAKEKKSEIIDLSSYATVVFCLPQGITANLLGGVKLNGNSALVPVPGIDFSENGLTGIGVKSRKTGTFAVVQCMTEFKDLENHWAGKAINLLAARLIVSGVNQDSFAPDRNVTRSQFATMVVKALGLQPKHQALVFTDVNQNDWYNGYLAAGVEAGIISGFADKTFRPELSITREEAAVLVLKAMKSIHGQTSSGSSGSIDALDRFKDKNKISIWAQEYIARLVGNGLMQGYSNGIFAPGKRISRAESAVVVRNFLSKTGLI